MHTRILIFMLLSGLVISTDTSLSPKANFPYSISNHSIPLLPPNKEYDLAGWFAGEVFIGSQSFPLAMDTGSSDIWLVATDTECVNPAIDPSNAETACSSSVPKFNPIGVFELDSKLHLNVSYANNAVINGPLGYSEIIIGGLTVSRQLVSPATLINANPLVLGNLTGILGLSYPSLTSAFPGTDPSKDIVCKGNSSCGPVSYSPLLTTIFHDALTEPVFSFALSRSDNFGGIMTIGGVPDLNSPVVNASKTIVASTPLVPFINTTQLVEYSFQIDGLAYANSTPGAGQGIYFLDSGTIPNKFPKDQADAINAMFDPPATFNETLGTYFVSCNASAPELGISIGGQIFYHNTKDMILHAGQDCFSAVQASQNEKLLVIGAIWMKSVLAVFDVGASEMTFLSRMDYLES